MIEDYESWLRYGDAYDHEPIRRTTARKILSLIGWAVAGFVVGTVIRLILESIGVF